MAGGLRIDTLAARGAGEADPATGGVVPPLQPSTTFERGVDLEYPRGFSYGRADHPTQVPPERLIARLEGADEALLFASGMAAATSLFLALDPGAHVVAPARMYWSLRRWLLDFGRRWGLDVELVDTMDARGLQAVLRPGKTRLVWVETPANPTWALTDVRLVAELAHAAGASVAVDNTVATPVLTRPLALGADFVMHSATKALNGHSDVLAGVLATAARSDPLWARVRDNRAGLGPVLGPFEAWLLLRGLRTLPLRVRAASATALTVARHLEAHPRVAEVMYPGLASHPDHAVAAAQMEGGFGTMLSFRPEGGDPVARSVHARVRLWTRATSLGGVESLIEHRASVEGPGSPIPPDLLRLSVGIEAVEDLLEDLDQALS